MQFQAWRFRAALKAKKDATSQKEVNNNLLAGKAVVQKVMHFRCFFCRLTQKTDTICGSAIEQKGFIQRPPRITEERLKRGKNFSF